jgi:hypothetical protein
MSELELLVDGLGLHRVVELLAEVCHEKSEHMTSAWQDEDGARLWRRAARALERATSSIEV